MDSSKAHSASSRPSAYLLLNRAVLLDVGLDLLDDWPVLNLSEGLGVTDGTLAGLCSL